MPAPPFPYDLFLRFQGFRSGYGQVMVNKKSYLMVILSYIFYNKFTKEHKKMPLFLRLSG